MTIIKSLQTINAGEGVGKREPSYIVAGHVIDITVWRAVWRFLKKKNLEPPYDPAVPLLDIYLEKIII